MEGDNSSKTVPDLICSYLEPNTTCPLPSDADMRIIKSICTAARTQGYVLFTVALVIGLPGSILALITMCRMPLKPSTLYLCLLSASDFVSLVFVSFTYYETLDIKRPSDWQELSKWIGRVFQAFSHWLLVLICVERFATVRFPLQKSTVYTVRTALYTCIAALLLSCVPLTLFCLGFYEIVTHQKFRFYYIIIYLSIYIFVPMSLIIVFTSLTAMELRKTQERRRNLTRSGHHTSKMEAELTRMMFLGRATAAAAAVVVVIVLVVVVIVVVVVLVMVAVVVLVVVMVDISWVDISETKRTVTQASVVNKPSTEKETQFEHNVHN
ncbi:growth hormone secretagogue receptor type 1 [Elysia marginata]|uniref:Growth hormone secretagogue receptor type 1 n=1 Tax=Elysia marginata TaxID=1093978 RepID=A0AAV4FZD9_9GAST|nr:growth hormone secretagogue receptor type 1 [Elysia marginata]